MHTGDVLLLLYALLQYGLAHNPKDTEFRSQLWEHNNYINDMTFSIPSQDYCSAHTTANHLCQLYTVSDDRQLKVQDNQSS
jgi:hypothetical protein